MLNVKSYFEGLLLAVVLPTFAQDAKQDYLPPSPTVAALGKYVDAPVSLFTGTPDITLPIYEINVNGFKLPISLSYHAGGFRVSEESGWVGLGWSLNAGGVVTRSIRHLLDNPGTRDNYFDAYDGRVLTVNSDYSDLYRLADDKPDGFPDLYVYNFNGHTGKFIYVKGNTYLLPKKPLQLVPDAGMNSWVVKDEQGNTYFFTIVEKAKTKSQTTATFENVSFYLSKIITAKNQEITFLYKSTEFFQSVNFSEVVTYKQVLSHWQMLGSSPNSFITTVYGKELEKIIFPQGEVEFISGFDREDINHSPSAIGALRLRKIVVKDKSGTIKKLFHLMHDYFYTDDSGPTSSDCDTKRLKLISVVEDPSPNPSLELIGNGMKYYFEYNTSVNLPRKSSLKQDHWGFYNNNTANTLVPPLVTNTSEALTNIRDADPDKASACLLSKINYPTGGSTEYFYETHEFGFSSTGEVPVWYKKENVIVTTQYAEAYTNYPSFSPDRPTHETSFTVSIEQNIKVEVNIFYPPGGVDGTLSQAKIEIYQADPGDPLTLLETYHYTENGDHFITLTPGTYKLKAIGTMSGSKALAKVTTQTFNLVAKHEKIAGGARVYKIIQADGFNPPMVTKYTYDLNNNPDYSSGVIVQEPNYLSYSYIYQLPIGCAPEITSCNCSEIEINLMSVSSQNVYSLGSGNHIGYKEVHTHLGENDENGKTITTFSTDPNYTYGTESDVSWRRGNVLTSTDYDKAGKKIRFVKNDYGIITQDLIYGLVVQSAGLHPCVGEYSTYGYPAHFSQTASIMSSELFGITKNYTEEYGSTASPLIKEVEYFYDNPNHLQVSRTTSKVNSKIINTYSAYPHDYLDNSGFINDLKLNNHVTLPIEQVTWQTDLFGNNPEVLSGSLSLYSSNGQLTEVKGLELANPLSANQFKFSTRIAGTVPPAGNSSLFQPFSGYVPKLAISYSETLNPIQVLPEKGTPTSYIWGYNNTFPIAKVVNATPSQIAFTGFENDNEGGWDNYAGNSIQARTGVKAYTGILTKSGLPSATYSISVWTKDGTGSPSISGQTPTIGELTLGWRQYRWVFSTSGQVTINSNGSIIDDVRLHPVSSFMTSLIYDSLHGPISISDQNDVNVNYVYDSIGRLKEIKDNKGNVLNSFQYHIKGQ